MSASRKRKGREDSSDTLDFSTPPDESKKKKANTMTKSHGVGAGAGAHETLPRPTRAGAGAGAGAGAHEIPKAMGSVLLPTLSLLESPPIQAPKTPTDTEVKSDGTGAHEPPEATGLALPKMTVLSFLQSFPITHSTDPEVKSDEAGVEAEAHESPEDTGPALPKFTGLLFQQSHSIKRPTAIEVKGAIAKSAGAGARPTEEEEDSEIIGLIGGFKL